MRKNNWEKVEAIFHRTLDLPAEERRPYLQRACGDDRRLFSEVESLINSLENDSNFLDDPVFELGLGVLHKNGQKSFAGRTVGFYEVREKIGAGGMGEVYQAVDTRLNRRVALKFLSGSLEDDQAAKRRLVKEAQAAAALDHSNICAVHGIEESEGHQFIVMQYVEGKTLAEIIEEGTVGVEEFRSIARQVITAVAFAHSHGVIHRDLKPGNIMVTPERQVKVLDFGLAKVVRQKQTHDGEPDNRSDFSQNGLVLGTVAYMSPEQLRGEKVGFRSDIFSVGIVLYELLAGKNPFGRKSQAETIAAILNDEPPALERISPDFPAGLVGLVKKCLQKDPEKRFQSAAEILVELDKTGSGGGRRRGAADSAAAAGQRRSLTVKAALVAVLLLAVFASGVYFYGLRRPARTLAVLPISFDGAQSDKEYLADGMTQSIIDKLSNLSDLDVKNESLVSRYRGKAVESRSAGRELNVDAVLAGDIRPRAAGRLVLTLKLIRVSDGMFIDQHEEEIDEAKLIELTENIASRIIGKIQMRLTDEDHNKLARKDTEVGKARELYWQGRLFLKRRNDNDALNKAIEFFTDAKDLDQKYAKAWAGLADAYISQSTPGVNGAITPEKAVTLAKPAANKALELDNTLCEAYHSLGLIGSRYEWKWADAESNFRTAIACDGEFLPARFGLTGVLIMQRRFDEALEEVSRIKEIDPVSINADLETATIHYMKQDYARTDKILSDLLERSRDNKRAIYLRGYQFLNTGRLREATELFEAMYRSDNEADKVFAAAPLGFAYAKAGRRDEARRIIEDLGKFRKNNYVPAQEKALIYVGLGDYDGAFENLRQSCGEKFYALPSWVIDPVVDEVKADPRFAEIRKCVNL